METKRDCLADVIPELGRSVRGYDNGETYYNGKNKDNEGVEDVAGGEDSRLSYDNEGRGRRRGGLR